MKTFILKISSLLTVIGFVLITVSATSCKKDQTCHGDVTVVDTLGVPLTGANVLLSAPSTNPPGEITYFGVTGVTGKVKFDVKLPAIFDVTAEHADYPGLRAEGIIRLNEPGKSSQVTVKLK